MYLHPSYMCKSLRCIPSCPVPVIALACMDPQPKRALARAASRHGAGSSAPCTAARMTARALRPRAGRPEFGLDVDNIRPIQVVVGAALAMLALGKPLSGSRGFGGLQFGLPVSGDAVAKARPRQRPRLCRGGGAVGRRRAAARRLAGDAVGRCTHVALGLRAGPER